MVSMSQIIEGIRSPRRTVSYVRRRGIREAIWEGSEPIRQWHFSRNSTHIYEEDWELLLLLDACRVDTLEKFSGKFDWLNDVNDILSVGSQSEEWMRKTFSEDWTEEMRNTTYITGNPYSESTLNATDFHHMDEVWRYAWDDDLGTIPARPIVDQIIKSLQHDPSDRTIGHFMQPHLPAVVGEQVAGRMSPDTFGESWTSPWDGVRQGKIDPLKVKSAYERNTKYILQEVNLLLNNIDVDSVVISADHANAFGERGVWGHPANDASEAVRTVPWCRTTAKNRGDYSPDVYDKSDSESTVNKRLRALGYKE